MEKRRSSMNNDVQMGMWIVLSAHRKGALQNLIHVTQEYKISLLAVQEVRWLGRSITKKKVYKMYYICDDEMFLEHTVLLVNAYYQELLILSY
jgi:hypothetical protein